MTARGVGGLLGTSYGRFVPPGATESIYVSAEDDDADYATLTEAVAAILSWYIPGDAFVDIELAGEHFAASSETVVVRHPCGERIRIFGAPYLQEDIVSLQGAPTGAAGAWSVVINVSDTAGMSVGDYAVLAARDGTGPWEIHSGTWEITNVDTGNDRITVTNTAQNASFPSTTLTDGTVNVLRTVLTFEGCDGIRVEGSDIGLLKNIQIVGDLSGDFSGCTSSGLDGDADPAEATGTGSIVCGEFVGVAKFGANGVVAKNCGFVFANSLASSSNGKHGFYAHIGSGIEAREGAGSGNVENGVVSDYGASAWTAGGHFCGNGGNGIFLFNGAHVTGNEMKCNANIGHGIDARHGDISAEIGECDYNEGGGIIVNNGSRALFDESSASNNTGAGVEVLRGGVARCGNIVASSNTTYGIHARLNGFVSAISATTASNGTKDRLCETGGTIEDPAGTLSTWKTVVRAYMGSNQALTSGGAAVVINYTTEATDSQSEYTPATPVFTASSARNLLVHAVVRSSAGAVGEVFQMRIRKNGSGFAVKNFVVPVTDEFTIDLTEAIQVAAGDTIDVTIRQVSGSNRTLTGDADFSYLRIVEL